ncbi:AAA family ATPase [Actinomadura sp. ATCC 31491]|uniref:AAA family ATPase n=1 Tax=Actinomadura luzonensis TaxID=2805427 RepID=A0ABT0G1W8_9ACTN|nr:AAA family ATPase [Actinomadura luzonensis]
MARAWVRAQAGRTGVLLIVGDPGIGKSWLAEEVARLAGARGGLVLRARCHEIERPLFLQPFVDALRVAGLAGYALRDLAGEWAGALERLSRGESLERRHAYEAVTAFLRALAERETVLLVLEDLHAAGAPTVELVHYLARRVRGARLLVLATARPAPPGPPAAAAASGGPAEVERVLGEAAEVIRLGPLPPEAVRELAVAAGLGPELGEAVFLRTRGHPRCAVELLRGMAAGEPGVPEPVRAWVLGRVRGLGEQAERLLRAACLLGPAFDPVALGRLAGVPARVAARHCERALAAGLLTVSGGSYEFASDLTREALDATTPEPTRLVYAGVLRSGTPTIH